jgi:hypothetical protein
VQLDDVVEEQARDRGGSVGVSEQEEVRIILGEAVDDGKDFPPTLGSPSMKSMAMLAQTTEGTWIGCSRPTGRNYSILFC